jgi:hypothetical protein
MASRTGTLAVDFVVVSTRNSTALVEGLSFLCRQSAICLLEESPRVNTRCWHSRKRSCKASEDCHKSEELGWMHLDQGGWRWAMVGPRVWDLVEDWALPSINVSPELIIEPLSGTLKMSNHYKVTIKLSKPWECRQTINCQCQAISGAINGWCW